MRPRPASQVIKTDEEVLAEMEAGWASSDEIDAVMKERQENAAKAQEQYDKKTSAPFVASLNEKTGNAPATVWDKG